MSFSYRVATVAIVATLLVPGAMLATLTALLAPGEALATDDYTAAIGGAPNSFKLCGENNAPLKTAACKKAGYDKMVAQIDRAFAMALVSAPANVQPLLKRDQVWFNEVILNAAESVPLPEGFGESLQQRVTTLETIAAGFGRPGFSGKWANAFGSIMVTPAEGGVLRLAIETRAVYGRGDNRVRECKAAAVVKQASGGWLTGTILPVENRPARKSDDKTADGRSKPAEPPLSIKVRHQGETLRVVVSNQAWQDDDHCRHMWQNTASYFASGKPDATADKADITFVVPTFDCTRPESASDEEICADPDLAENDQRLSRAWKALLPRLDKVTRRALTEDQRGYVRAQARQYPEFLHPDWEKRSYFMHFTTDARDKLDRLQRERIALLEGFDEKRSGFAGLWLNHTAILKVTVEGDGGLKAGGWKWTQGDWKAGCDFGMQGKVVGGLFRSDGKRNNPDTLERDHASLIVNRLDEVFAEKREGPDSDFDEPKCKRNATYNSTTRLFPAHPSADIDNLGGSIR